MNCTHAPLSIPVGFDRKIALVLVAVNARQPKPLTTPSMRRSALVVGEA